MPRSKATCTTPPRPARRSHLSGLLVAALFVPVPSGAAGDDARAALARAEAAVEAARARQALWTTAVQALRDARRALERGADDQVLHWSARAVELAELGLRQRASQPEPLPTDPGGTSP